VGRYHEVYESLQVAGVRFVVVGGMAVVLSAMCA
jgi:hypothetical protein